MWTGPRVKCRIQPFTLTGQNKGLLTTPSYRLQDLQQEIGLGFGAVMRAYLRERQGFASGVRLLQSSHLREVAGGVAPAPYLTRDLHLHCRMHRI